MTDNVALLTVREVADLLGVSAGTVYALVAARKIRHERIGVGRGTIRIPADAVDEYREHAADGNAHQRDRPPVQDAAHHACPYTLEWDRQTLAVRRESYRLIGELS